MSALTLQRFVLTVLLVVLVVGGQESVTEPAHGARCPNVLVILADDLGYGDLSSYGATDLRTPHIDALVASGMRFDSFYANCPVCSPTRASLLTGCYPELVGVPGVIRTHRGQQLGVFVTRCGAAARSVARGWLRVGDCRQVASRAGDAESAHQRGFDHFDGFLGDMMDDYYHHRRQGNNYMRHDREEITPAGHATDLFTQWACSTLKTFAQQDKPFFLYLAYNAPHTPIQPPPDWLERVEQREQGITPRRAKLVALIEHLDDGVGRVMRCLKDSGLAENTLVIFTSDNGGQLSAGANNGPLRDGKQSMYEGGLRVPTCAVWPGVIPERSHGQGRWLTMDLFPTICAAAGATTPDSINGVSLLPTLRGIPQTVPPRDLFFHRREGGEAYQGLTIAAMIRGDWKLVRNSPFAPIELFNLATDPWEEHDLAAQQRDVFRQLAAALRQQVQRGGAVPWQAPEQQ